MFFLSLIWTLLLHQHLLFTLVTNITTNLCVCPSVWLFKCVSRCEQLFKALRVPSNLLHSWNSLKNLMVKLATNVLQKQCSTLCHGGWHITNVNDVFRHWKITTVITINIWERKKKSSVLYKWQQRMFIAGFNFSRWVRETRPYCSVEVGFKRKDPR
jgi:hypothetical protein